MSIKVVPGLPVEYVHGRDHDPDVAIANGFCPECGADLWQLDARFHEREHWPDLIDPNDPKSKEAIRRRKLIRDFIAAHGGTPKENAQVALARRNGALVNSIVKPKPAKAGSKEE